MFDFLRRLFGARPPSSASSRPAEAGIAASQSKKEEAVSAPSTEATTRYAIIGAGPAGVVAADALRARDPEGKITLIHGEPGVPYSRMAIPYWLSGKIGEEGMALHHDPRFYADRRIDIRHARVRGIDVGERSLALADAGRLQFEKLLIASGSTPLRPPIEGLDLPGVLPCWTAEDARSIIGLAEPGAHVILLGAGFIGCIVLEALAQRGVSLSVVEMGDRMVPRMLDEVAGNMLRRWCEQKGIAVRTSTRIVRIAPADGAPGDREDTLMVDLDDGTRLPAHMVVVAAGVRANTELLDGTGVKADQGVLVDDHLRSTVDVIYAAGDAAQGPDFSTQGFSVHAVQPTAADHGRFAAVNMAGGDARYAGSLVMNVLDTVGLVSCSFGAWQGVDGGEQAARVDEESFRYISLQFDNDHLIGGQCVGRTDWIGMMRGLIQTKVPLGPWKQKLKADPHRLAEAYVARAGS